MLDNIYIQLRVFVRVHPVNLGPHPSFGPRLDGWGVEVQVLIVARVVVSWWLESLGTLLSRMLMDTRMSSTGSDDRLDYQLVVVELGSFGGWMLKPSVRIFSTTASTRFISRDRVPITNPRNLHFREKNPLLILTGKSGFFYTKVLSQFQMGSCYLDI